MKTMKRIFSIALALALVASCFVSVTFAAETDSTTAATGTTFSDVAEDAPYATAVKTFTQMGILTGYPDGTFRPDQNVTRAEFTAMMMRALNYGSLGSPSAADLPFSDVSESNSDISWAIPNINTAYGMGVINGYEDGTFRPSDNVAYEEAAKMIIYILGYTEDLNVEPWYSNVISQAGRLGITRYASGLGKVETPASRACLAQMIYDSLEVNLIEQNTLTNKTILTDYLGYIKNVGTIASDGITSITAPDVNLRSNEIQIYAKDPTSSRYETNTYRTTDNSLKNYLGYRVEYYYKDNGGSGDIRDLALYVLEPHKELTLNASMIEPDDSSNNQIRYYESDDARNTTQVSLDNNNVVIYNGKLNGSSDSDPDSRFDVNMIPKVGTVTLLDADGDNRYEIVKIQDYEVYYVSSKVSASYSIVDEVTRSTDKSLILDVDDTSIGTTIINGTGNNISYSSIGTGDIICLARSNEDNGGDIIQTAVVLNNTVRGTITAVNRGESVTISGKTYKFSAAAPWMEGGSGTQSEPELQDNGTYCLDINGDIVCYKRDAVSENVSYGVIMNISSIRGNDFGNEKNVYILSQNGQEITARLYDNTKVYQVDDDGNNQVIAQGSVEAEEALRDVAQNYDQNLDDELVKSSLTAQQLVKYTTRVSSGNTVLDKIYVASPADSGAQVESAKLMQYTRVNGSMEMTYNSSSAQLRSADGINVSIRNATIFVVPSDRSDRDGYAKNSLSATFKNNQKYNVDLFDVSTANSAGVVVCYGGNSSSEVDDSTPVGVITDVSYETNGDYGNMTRITYITSGGEAKAWISDSGSDWDPRVGDIFRAGTDRDGFTVMKEENIIFSRRDIARYGRTPSSGDFWNADYAMVLGSVTAKDETAIAIYPGEIHESDIRNDLSRALTFDVDEFDRAVVVRYDDRAQDEVAEVTGDDKEGILMGLTGYQEDGLANPSKVMLYMSDGKIKLFCVLDEGI